MQKKVYIYDGKDVVVWGINDVRSSTMNVAFSYLLPGNRIGKELTKEILQDDYYLIFLRTNRRVEIGVVNEYFD